MEIDEQNLFHFLLDLEIKFAFKRPVADDALTQFFKLLHSLFVGAISFGRLQMMKEAIEKQ